MQDDALNVAIGRQFIQYALTVDQLLRQVSDLTAKIKGLEDQLAATKQPSAN